MTHTRVLVWGLSALLFGISFVIPWLFWCFIPAFALLLSGISSESSYIRLFLLGTLVGTLQYACTFVWLWSTFPINWMPQAHVLIQFSAIGLYWILNSLVMGLGTGFFSIAAKAVIDKKYTVISIPMFWVASELLKSFIFSVYTQGPGSELGINFSFGYIGYLVAEYGALLQLSIFGGVYALSFVGAWLGFALYLFCRAGWYQKPAYVLVAFVFFAAPFMVPLTIHTYSTVGHEVVSLETYFNKQFMEKEDALRIKQDEIKRAASAALSTQPDYIIMPEDTHLRESFTSTEAMFDWLNFVAQKPAVIIDNSAALDARNKKVIRTYMYDTSTSSVYFLDKKHLVPQGEYLSYLHDWILSLFASDEGMRNIRHFARLRPGIQSDSQAIPQHFPGVLFCFETSVPVAVKRAQGPRNPSFIAHSISYAWFTHPFSLEYQLDSMLKVHAVWNNIPIISSGGMTASKLYHPSGMVKTGEVIDSSEFWSLKRFSI